MNTNVNLNINLKVIFLIIISIGSIKAGGYLRSFVYDMMEMKETIEAQKIATDKILKIDELKEDLEVERNKTKQLEEKTKWLEDNMKRLENELETQKNKTRGE